jgi:hypothetical protein
VRIVTLLQGIFSASNTASSLTLHILGKMGWSEQWLANMGGGYYDADSFGLNHVFCILASSISFLKVGVLLSFPLVLTFLAS